MRLLPISLISVTILATISLGWLFDKVYEQYQSEKQPSTTIEIVEKMGSDLAEAMDATPNTEAFIPHWPKTSMHKLSLGSLADSELPQALIHQLKRGETIILETKSTLLFHYYLNTKKQILVLESPRLTQKKQHTYQQYTLTLLFYFLLILLFLLWAYPLLKQLSSLRNAAISFGKGKLDEQINSKPTSYIRDIELEFNNMAKRINNLMDDVKLLSTAVSHDLRTPLARIRFGLDTLEEVKDGEQRDRLQQKLGKDVDEMTSLVEALLNFTRLDQKTVVLKKVPINLADVINECLLNKVNDKVKIHFNCIAAQASTVADKNYLKMALNNVIQNAINYGHEKVNIVLDSDPNWVIIRVSDDGEGVPTAIREQIVKPFIRGIKNQTNYKGHGVGLAIVKRVLDWHNGTLTIGTSKELFGAEFTVTLPKC